MKPIDELNFSGKKVLIRVDFNVPLDDDQKILDDTKIKASLKTLNKILKDGGALIIMSHLGRPDKGPEDKFSQRHLVSSLSEQLKTKVKFANDCIGENAREMAKDLAPGEVLLLENTRFYKEEKMGDKDFALKLAQLVNDNGDDNGYYVNDAFATAHRAHASTTIVANYFTEDKKLFGYLMINEIKNAEKTMNNAVKPFTALLGGAKVSDKILLIENLMEKIDHLIIGGAMTYTFFRALGHPVGNSLVEIKKIDVARSIIEKARISNVNFILPRDSVISDWFGERGNTQVCDNTKIPEQYIGMDIGPEAIKEITPLIHRSKTILWNGTMGVYEMDKFSDGTRKIGEAIVQATQNGCYTLVGGGDTVAAARKFDLVDKVSFASTGGGALLQYFEGKRLPGIDAITNPKPALIKSV